MAEEQKEPSALQWAKAQATDTLDTGRRALGFDEPTFRGGTYEPFGHTKELIKDYYTPANFQERFAPAEKQPLQEMSPEHADMMQKIVEHPDFIKLLLQHLGIQ